MNNLIASSFLATRAHAWPLAAWSRFVSAGTPRVVAHSEFVSALAPHACMHSLHRENRERAKMQSRHASLRRGAGADDEGSSATMCRGTERGKSRFSNRNRFPRARKSNASLNCERVLFQDGSN
uniref:Putative secreted protein n=1 Tax=Ixodes ricinus TaxID=34613 RepID=A0A6B0UNX3_IXORI